MTVFPKIILSLLAVLAAAGGHGLDRKLDKALRTEMKCVRTLVGKADSAGRLPRTTDPSGKLVLVGPHDWTSGFFPGILWELYGLTGDSTYRSQARKFTGMLSSVPEMKNTHDLGFMVFCSYGHQYAADRDEESKKAIIKAAESLYSRYDEKIGLIRSWDFGKWNYPVIIDNMMNLELLFEASEITRDFKYRQIAIDHADNTMRNHFREDFSSWHVVSYNSDGSIESKGTHQGYSDGSVWARGQAWGLYGYTLCYRYTRDPKYLSQARAIADFIISDPRIPSDHIPYWDYCAPDIPDAPRDVSAAAITASAMLELCGYCPKDAGGRYREYSCSILASLCSPKYLSKPGRNAGFLLGHSTGNLPGGVEIDVPLVYADYYFLEAIGRYRSGVQGYAEEYAVKPSRGRLFIGDEEFARLRMKVESGTDRNLSSMHSALAANADRYASDTSLPEYKLDESGRRLLRVSNKALCDIFACSYMYRFTGEEKYLDKVRGVMDAVCAFPDWHPAHFLDVAEMAAAVSIGYDWLREALPDSTCRNAVRTLQEYALTASLDTATTRTFVLKNNNWNQVCGGGLICAALVTYQYDPVLAGSIIRRGIESEAKHILPVYEPDGIYPEGVSYWTYGSAFQILSCMALESVYGQDFGLGSMPGFASSPRFVVNSCGTCGDVYNFSDAHPAKPRFPQLWYFASRYGDWSVLSQSRGGFVPEDAADRLFPLYLISAFRAGTPAYGTSSESRRFFSGDGVQPLVMAKAGAGPDGLYLAAKGGRAEINHGHMDAGSFVFDAYGYRWAADPAIPPYALSENAMKKVDGNMWLRKQNSLRWRIFAYNNLSHNTLTVNGKDHMVDSTATLMEVYDTDSRMGGCFNLTPVFGGEVEYSARSLAIVDGNHLEVSDRIRACRDREASVRWTLATYAKPEVVSDGILLRQGDVTMKLQAAGVPVGYRIWSSDPSDYDSPVKDDEPDLDVYLCGFEFVVQKSQDLTILATITKVDG